MAKKFDIQTRQFNIIFKTKSKVLHTKSAIGAIIASTDETNPPKLITDKNGIMAIFVKNEYELIVLK